MSLKSKTSIARPGSTSLRATVPEGIAAFLELNEGVFQVLSTNGNTRLGGAEKRWRVKNGADNVVAPSVFRNMLFDRLNDVTDAS